jgi:outer membrane protein
MNKTILLLVFLVIIFPATAQEFKIGVVTDFGKTAEMDSVLRLMVNQIDQTIGSSKNVTLNANDVSYDNSDFQTAVENYNQLLKRTDLVILIGATVLRAFSGLKTHPLPTFGLGVIDPAIQDIPFVKGKSGIANFTYIWSSNGLEADLTEFQKIVPFKNLTLLTNPGAAYSIMSDEQNAALIALEKELDASINVVELEDDIRLAFEKLDPETDAVYISDLGVRSKDEIRSLADQLIIKGLPSFSSNKWHVDQGIMACMAADNSFDQIMRKLGVMVDEALAGKPLSEMEVRTTFSERLFINENTANSISLSLPFEVLFIAKLVKTENGLPVYSLSQIMELAFEHNLSITISQQDVELAIQDVKLARSAVLPNLDLTVNAKQINEESANALFDQPERKLNGSLQLNQVIYSQEAFAGIKIAKYFQKAQEHLTNAEILDVMLNVYNDYLNVLAAKSILQIEEENLENLEINLNIAKLQVESGALSQTELYRWESEVALASQQVVEASTNLMALKSQLNNSLAYQLEKDFDVEDIAVDGQLYKQFREGIISRYIENAADIRALIGFLVEEAVNSNPNKLYILEQMNALDRKRKQDKRLFYTPDIALQAGISQVFVRGGASSTPIEGIDFVDNTWNIGIGLRYPIFSQLTRKTNLRTSTIQLDQLNNSRVQLDQNLELAVRTSVLNTIAASTNIDFSRLAAVNAENNFSLMQLRYGEGDIDITQLIDAQRNAIQAKQRYAVSVYDFIRNQLNIQYAVGFFPMLSDEATNEEFRTRFLQYQNANPNE